jgi:hypothetical protein
MNLAQKQLLRAACATVDRSGDGQHGTSGRNALAPSAQVVQRTLRARHGEQRYIVTISAQPDYVWYRVPKTGTRSVRAALLAASPDIICTDLYGGIVVPSVLVRGVFAFTFVRDPRTRLVSAWRDKVVRRNTLSLPDEVHQRLTSFSSFVSYLEGLDLRTCNRHFRLQSALVDPARVDFIGRFESLETDFADVARHLGLASQKLPHLNATHGGEHDWPTGTLNRVENLYREDLDMFGY